ncbi:hypothetical protein [Phthorimaea operculella granulovirus]|uniref:Uncharacterized protein n=1 Tax=Phthorimaea operculella granulovirus TaxID=192584 RepID=Q8JS27_9BBAC|nr:hypothetical protein [Phthorimaea operculella granulovirus]AAM70230.1 hypothetical protein [Phthorimaea operculella granulovirus]QBH66387.1 hypothetical protein PhopGVgp032 [Phthorimaea operculella granulovirus]QBH66517.1 hypothetical protein PhopGVgp032 [Phthorimaea operculella granulovirus]
MNKQIIELAKKHLQCSERDKRIRNLLIANSGMRFEKDLNPVTLHRLDTEELVVKILKYLNYKIRKKFKNDDEKKEPEAMDWDEYETVERAESMEYNQSGRENLELLKPMQPANKEQFIDFVKQMVRVINQCYDNTELDANKIEEIVNYLFAKEVQNDMTKNFDPKKLETVYTDKLNKLSSNYEQKIQNCEQEKEKIREMHTEKSNNLKMQIEELKMQIEELTKYADQELNRLKEQTDLEISNYKKQLDDCTTELNDCRNELSKNKTEYQNYIKNCKKWINECKTNAQTEINESKTKYQKELEQKVELYIRQKENEIHDDLQKKHTQKIDGLVQFYDFQIKERDQSIKQLKYELEEKDKRLDQLNEENSKIGENLNATITNLQKELSETTKNLNSVREQWYSSHLELVETIEDDFDISNNQQTKKLNIALLNEIQFLKLGYEPVIKFEKRDVKLQREVKKLSKELAKKDYECTRIIETNNERFNSQLQMCRQDCDEMLRKKDDIIDEINKNLTNQRVVITQDHECYIYIIDIIKTVNTVTDTHLLDERTSRLLDPNATEITKPIFSLINYIIKYISNERDKYKQEVDKAKTVSTLQTVFTQENNDQNVVFTQENNAQEKNEKSTRRTISSANVKKSTKRTISEESYDVDVVPKRLQLSEDYEGLDDDEEEESIVQN